MVAHTAQLWAYSPPLRTNPPSSLAKSGSASEGGDALLCAVTSLRGFEGAHVGWHPLRGEGRGDLRRTPEEVAPQIPFKTAHRSLFELPPTDPFQIPFLGFGHTEFPGDVNSNHESTKSRRFRVPKT